MDSVNKERIYTEMMVLNVVNIFFSMLKVMQFLRLFKGQGMLV
jgi:hypothetical protein